MVTASVVLYNTDSDLLNRVVDSFCPSKDRHLLLVDNSPSRMDGFGEKQYITYIFNGRNLGYGAAHNIAIEWAIKAGADYHIVLNPDLQFEPDVIDELVSYANRHKSVGYILPKVIYPNGDLQYLCKLLPTPMDLIFRRFLPSIGFIKKKNDRYELRHSGYDFIMNPPCLSGCFMFLRIDMLSKNRIRFDDRFFMYCEDFDLIRRIHRVGKTVYYPKCTIIHDHKRDSYKNIKMLKMHIMSAIKYFNKYGWFIDSERKIFNNRILNEIRNKKGSR